MASSIVKRIPIGPVQVYWNRARLGSPGSSAVINYTINQSITTTGDNIGQMDARRTAEEATIQVTVKDLKPSQLRYAYGNAMTLLTGSLMSSNYFVGSATTIRQWRQLLLTGSGLTNGLVSVPAAYTSATVVVYSSDYETEYTQGTDFTTNTTCDGIYRTTGGTIASGAYVIAHYDVSATMNYIRTGGADANFEAQLLLVGQTPDGSWFQVKAWRAIREGAANFTVNAKGDYDGMTLSFRCLADLTQTKGSQLIEVATTA